MNDQNQTSSDNLDSATTQLLREGFGSYLDVVRCVHHFQSEIAKVLKSVLEFAKDQISSTLKIEVGSEGHPLKVSMSVWPAFPDDIGDYDNESCSINADVWLVEPHNCTLTLVASFEDTKEGGVKQVLYCAFYVSQKYRRDKLWKRFRGHDNCFSESWEEYAVGLKRPWKSADTLREELAQLLDDFLKCCKATPD